MDHHEGLGSNSEAVARERVLPSSPAGGAVHDTGLRRSTSQYLQSLFSPCYAKDLRQRRPSIGHDGLLALLPKS